MHVIPLLGNAASADAFDSLFDVREESLALVCDVPQNNLTVREKLYAVKHHIRFLLLHRVPSRVRRHTALGEGWYAHVLGPV